MSLGSRRLLPDLPFRLQGRARGVAIPYPGSSLPGVCAIVVAVGSVHKALEMQAQARLTTKRAKTRAGRAIQAHDTTLGARGALLQACPVQKWPGGHTWSRDASKKHNKESKEYRVIELQSNQTQTVLLDEDPVTPETPIARNRSNAVFDKLLHALPAARQVACGARLNGK